MGHATAKTSKSSCLPTTQWARGVVFPQASRAAVADRPIRAAILAAVALVRQQVAKPKARNSKPRVTCPGSHLGYK